MCLCVHASLVVHVFTVYTLHSHFTGSARYASTYRAESTKHNPPSAAAEEAAGFWVDYRSRQPSLHCPPQGHWFSLTVTHHPLQPLVCDVIVNNVELDFMTHMTPD